MQFTTIFSRWAAALAVALTVLAGHAVRADDAPEKAPPVLLQTVAVKSLDTLAAVAKEVGFPLPPALTAAGLEEQFPFIGKDGLASDKPIGIAFFGAPGTSPQNLITFVFPIKPGKASIDSLKVFGKPMPGHDDTVLMQNDIGLRRTGDYLVFSPSAAAVVAVKPEDIADSVKAPDALAKLVIDVASVRKGAPELITDFLSNVEKNAKTDNTDPAFNAGSKFALDAFKNALNSLNHIEISVSGSEQALRVSASASPMKVPAVASVNVAGMPADIVGRLDMGVSSGEMFPQGRQMLEQALKAAIMQDHKDTMTDAQKREMAAMFKRLVALQSDAATTSVGVEMADDKPVVYLVQHWSKPMDCVKEIREMSETIKSMDAKETTGPVLELSTYEAGGKTIQRVVAMEKGKAIGSLDVVQIGDDAYYAVSAGDAKNIQKLLAAPKGPALKEAAAVSIDLGKYAQALSVLPDTDLTKFPPDVRKDIVDSLRGQKMKIAVLRDGDGAKLELTVDRRILQLVQKVMPK